MQGTRSPAPSELDQPIPGAEDIGGTHAGSKQHTLWTSIRKS